MTQFYCAICTDHVSYEGCVDADTVHQAAVMATVAANAAWVPYDPDGPTLRAPAWVEVEVGSWDEYLIARAGSFYDYAQYRHHRCQSIILPAMPEVHTCKTRELHELTQSLSE